MAITPRKSLLHCGKAIVMRNTFLVTSFFNMIVFEIGETGIPSTLDEESTA